MSIPVSSLSPKYQAQVSAQLHGKTLLGLGELPAAMNASMFPKKAPLRQKSGPTLNKLETAFLAYLTAKWHPLPAFAHKVTLHLANGVRYTPDFTVWTGARLRCYEVKGFMRDDAAVKLKVAASQFPWIEFQLAMRDRKTKAWQVTPVLA